MSTPMRYVTLAFVALACTAGGALAQQSPARDSVRASMRADFDRMVEEIARAVAAKRQEQAELVQQMARLSALRESDVARRQVEEQLLLAARQMRDLQRQLTEVCTQADKPSGWVGITLSMTAHGQQARDEGTVVLRVDGYPTVETVDPGSPAEQAGIQSGDVLLSLSSRDFRRGQVEIADLLKPGARLPVRVRRDGRVHALAVVVGRRPQALDSQCPWIDSRLAGALVDQPPMNIILRERVGTGSSGRASGGAAPNAAAGARRADVAARAPGQVTLVPVVPPVAVGTPGAFGSATVAIAGAEVVRMNADLLENFGVERGVLVINVVRGTPAAESGLRAGDVIVAAGDRPIGSVGTLLRAISEAPEPALDLQVIRKGKPTTVALRWK